MSAESPGIPMGIFLVMVGCVSNALIPTPKKEHSTEPDNTAVALDSECHVPPLDWNLKLRWSWDGANDLLVRSIHVGRFSDEDGDGKITVADPVGIWLTPPQLIGNQGSHFLISRDGKQLKDLWQWDDNCLTCYATVGETNPQHPGMEYILGSWDPSNQSYASSVGVDKVLYHRALGQVFDGAISLLDIDANGTPEVLWGSAVTSGVDGHILFTFDGNGWRNTSADLDLDGFPEILTTALDGIHILDHHGQIQAICPIPFTEKYYAASFAIGNLDADPEAEIVVAAEHLIATYEFDGTFRNSIATTSNDAAMVGIAELTGDDTPEIVIDYSTDVADESDASGIAAYRADLTLLWKHPSATLGWSRFALADLDGDGRHEIIVQEGSRLLILGPDGVVLSEIPTTHFESWPTPPAVVDLNGDGLAEIVTAGIGNHALSVYENDAGGWAVKGAEMPWPGVDHFVGDRRIDGSLPPPTDHFWLSPEKNVWQGLAAGNPELPDLGVSFADAYSDDCKDILFTLSVANHGLAAMALPVSVELLRIEDQGTLGSQLVQAPLESGEVRTVQFLVPVEEVGSGVRAVVNNTNAVAECENTLNEAEYVEIPCR